MFISRVLHINLIIFIRVMKTGQRWGSGGKRCWNEGPMLKETYCVWEESWLSVLLVFHRAET